VKSIANENRVEDFAISESLWSFPFLTFVFIISFEYLGLDNIPPLNVLSALKIPLLLSIFLFTYSCVHYGFGILWRFTALRLLLIFTALTLTALVLGLVQANALDPAKQQLGYLALAVAGSFLLTSLDRVKCFAGLMVILNVCLVLVNWVKLGAEVRAGAFVGGYFVGDGNDLAWSLVIASPMALFLVSTSRGSRRKLFWLVSFLFIAIGIVGTQSRGASLAASFSLLYIWLKVAKRKAVGVLAIAILSIGVLAVAPTQYFDRMGSVANYQEDTSATNRLHAWRRAMEMAIDNPVFGVGAGSFNSAYGRYYRNVESGDAVRWISPHSVYFKVLAEYGFLGVGVFLGILLSLWRTNRKSAVSLRESLGEKNELLNWPLYVNASLLGYLISGAFLGGVDYPHRFLLLAATIGVALVSKSKVIDRSADAIAH
jgi:probable O-glycosylation ligase (exosortase A-associated)